MVFERGDIVVVPFPFTDLSAVKQRPVLILSSQKFNKESEDVVTCAITSNLQDAGFSVDISRKDLKEGFIPVESKIKPGKLFTLHQRMVRKKVGSVQEPILIKTLEVLDKICGRKYR